MFDRCFLPSDMARLHETFQVLVPESNQAGDLVSRWMENGVGVRAVVTGWDSPPITTRMLEATPEISVLVHAAGSIKPFIPDTIWERPVRIATTNDALGLGVAETALGLIIASLKGFFPCAALTRSGRWQESLPERGYGRVREMFNLTVGIIGASRTGRHLIRLLEPFDLDVLLYDPTISENEAFDLGVQPVSLNRLMEASDVVSLHAPPLPHLRHLLSTPEFRAMKSDAIFINTARGMLVDEDALVHELETGRISAILDVTFPEPPCRHSRLRSLPNVVLLPHIAGAISNGCYRQGRSAVNQLMEWATGCQMSGELTPERLSVMA